MPDPILISALIMSIFTGICQIVQSYLDYKRDKLNNNNELYEAKNYSSNCCSINVISDNENE
jgi:hypothetical protein